MSSILLNCSFEEAKFEVFEELGPMNSLRGTATEEYFQRVFLKVEKTLIQYNLK